MTIVQTVSAQSKIIHQEHENLGVDPELLINKLSFSHIIELIGENDPTVRYALGNLANNVFVSKYKIALPTEKELLKLVKESKKLLSV